MRVLGAAALSLAAAQFEIHVDEVLDRRCQLVPAEFDPLVQNYTVDCPWDVRDVHVHGSGSNIEMGERGERMRAPTFGYAMERKVIVYGNVPTAVQINDLAAEKTYEVIVRGSEPPKGEMNPQSLVWEEWYNGAKRLHQFMARTLQGGRDLPNKPTLELLGLPRYMADDCAFIISHPQTGAKVENLYHVEVTCTESFLEQAETVELLTMGEHWDPTKDMDCEIMTQCEDPTQNKPGNRTSEELLSASERPWPLYDLHFFAGKRHTAPAWDFGACSRMTARCSVKDKKGAEAARVHFFLTARSDEYIEEELDKAPLEPVCEEPGLQMLRSWKTYDYEGNELADVECDVRGQGRNILLFCPSGVSAVKIMAAVRDPSALVLTHGKQLKNPMVLRDGTVFFPIMASVMQLGATPKPGEDDAIFRVKVICDTDDSTYQVTVTGPAVVKKKGAHLKTLHDNPVKGLDHHEELEDGQVLTCELIESTASCLVTHMHPDNLFGLALGQEVTEVLPAAPKKKDEKKDSRLRRLAGKSDKKDKKDGDEDEKKDEPTFIDAYTYCGTQPAVVKGGTTCVIHLPNVTAVTVPEPVEAKTVTVPSSAELVCEMQDSAVVVKKATPEGFGGLEPGLQIFMVGASKGAGEKQRRLLEEGMELAYDACEKLAAEGDGQTCNLKGRTVTIADTKHPPVIGAGCVATPAFKYDHFDYELQCPTKVKAVKIGQVAGHVNWQGVVTDGAPRLTVWYHDKDGRLIDNDWSPGTVPAPVELALGETTVFKMRLKHPGAKTYKFTATRHAPALLKAENTHAVANIMQTIALALAVMSGANVVTIVKFVQFMSLFSAMEGIPEAYSDFVSRFKSFNFDFSPAALIPHAWMDPIIDEIKKQAQDQMLAVAASAIPAGEAAKDGKESLEEGKENAKEAIEDAAKEAAELKAEAKAAEEQMEKLKKEAEELEATVKAKIAQMKEDMKVISKLLMVPVLVAIVCLVHAIFECRYARNPELRPQYSIKQFDLVPCIIFIVDICLVGFCLTACDVLYKGKHVEFLSWHPGTAKVHAMVVALVMIYPVSMLVITAGVAFYYSRPSGYKDHEKLVYNQELDTFTELECVEVNATQPWKTGLGFIDNKIGSVMPLQRTIRSVAPIERYDVVEKNQQLEASGKGDKAAELGDLAAAPVDDGKEKYFKVRLDSRAFRAEGGVEITPILTSCPDTLHEGEGGAGPVEETPGSNATNRSESEKRPLLPGVAPSGVMYRLSSVYETHGGANVGRINMAVPTVRGRTRHKDPKTGNKVSAMQAVSEDTANDYVAKIDMAAEVDCKHIPALNWYAPDTRIEVPSHNFGFKRGQELRGILAGGGPGMMGRFRFFTSRALQVGSIFLFAAYGNPDDLKDQAIGAAKAAAKDAAADAVNEAKAEITDHAKEAVKEATSRLLAAASDVAGAAAASVWEADAAAGDVAGRMLGEAEESPGLHEQIMGFFEWLLPTPGLIQVAILFAATFVTYAMSVQSLWDDVKKDKKNQNKKGKLEKLKAGKAMLYGLLFGDPIIFTAELALLIVLAKSTKQFPYAYMPLTNEGTAAITLMAVSSLAIIWINAQFLWEKGKEFVAWLLELPTVIKDKYTETMQTIWSWNEWFWGWMDWFSYVCTNLGTEEGRDMLWQNFKLGFWMEVDKPRMYIKDQLRGNGLMEDGKVFCIPCACIDKSCVPDYEELEAERLEKEGA